MDVLRKCFEALGHTSVETFIASGNVIFESRARNARTLEKAIERHLRESLGYEVATFVRSPAELAAVAVHQPFPQADVDADGHALYVGFLPEPPAAEAVAKLLARRNTVDEFHVHGRELYWLARQGMAESTFSGALLEKLLGMPATMRNVTTVRKLAAKYPAT
jgi:uncharacterized protein (DUF1697 family)